MKLSKQTSVHLKNTLREDIGKGDITSEILIPLSARAKALVIARESGVFCGEVVMRKIFLMVDPNLSLRFFVKDGKKFSRNAKVIEIRGRVRSILKAERTALNFLGHLCGIATLTRQFVDRVKKYSVSVFDTRKTTPLLRELEKYAVRTGGGKNHRMGLYDEIFVKENHRPYADLKKLRHYPGKFVMEVRNLRELARSLPLRPRVILFDNFTPGNLRRAVKLARARNPKIILEASGGVTLQNAMHFAMTGVDQISIGSLTHSIKAVDFSLIIRDGSL